MKNGFPNRSLHFEQLEAKLPLSATSIEAPGEVAAVVRFEGNEAQTREDIADLLQYDGTLNVSLDEHRVLHLNAGHIVGEGVGVEVWFEHEGGVTTLHAAKDIAIPDDVKSISIVIVDEETKEEISTMTKELDGTPFVESIRFKTHEEERVEHEVEHEIEETHEMLEELAHERSHKHKHPPHAPHMAHAAHAPHAHEEHEEREEELLEPKLKFGEELLDGEEGDAEGEQEGDAVETHVKKDVTNHHGEKGEANDQPQKAEKQEKAPVNEKKPDEAPQEKQEKPAEEEDEKKGEKRSRVRAPYENGIDKEALAMAEAPLIAADEREEVLN